jgi:hypothetical protein
MILKLVDRTMVVIMIQDTSRFVIGCRHLRVSTFIIGKLGVGKVARFGPGKLIDVCTHSTKVNSIDYSWSVQKQQREQFVAVECPQVIS